MAHRRLKLSLSAGEPLSTSLNWRIEVGCVVLTSWNDEEHPATLGIWGPGELVIPSLLGGQSLQLLSLSAVQVQEWTPSAEERQQVLSQQLLQLVKLLELSRIRRAEVRLYSLLLWLGERFGRVGSQGVSLSFNAMNLTHRNLAEITGLTRVTVTKALIRFRQEGRLSMRGHDELLQRHDIANPASA